MYYKSLQSTDAPGFLVMPSVAQSNMSHDTALLWASEIFDYGSNFGASSGRYFTAPHGGKYLFGGTCRIDGVPSDGGWMRPQWHSSNQIFTPNITGQLNLYGGNNPVYHHFPFTLMCQLDSSDTFDINWHQSGGSATADFHTESTLWGIGLM